MESAFRASEAPLPLPESGAIVLLSNTTEDVMGPFPVFAPRHRRAPPRFLSGPRAWLLAPVLILLLAPPARAEDAPPHYSADELDEMVAPIALYPDPILSQVMTASG